MFNDLSAVKAIQEFFGQDRKVTMTEFKELSKEDRAELANMIYAL